MASSKPSLAFKITLSVLQANFLLSVFTIERSYCAAPITAESRGFLLPETFNFCTDNNPLFLERPEWLRKATCVHSYLFWVFYASVLVSIWKDSLWTALRPFFLLFLGAKLYALGFYHYMQFTSHAPPPNPMMYFAGDSPYLLAIAMVLYKLFVVDTRTDSDDTTHAKHQ